MNFQFYFEKLALSKEFGNFRKEHPDAFLCSGFFSIDKEGNDNQQHFDYFDPKSKKMFSFKLRNKIDLIPVEDVPGTPGNYVPEKLKDNCDFDFNYIEKLIEGEMFEQKIKKKIMKMIFSLQSREGEVYLIGTVFLSGLAMISITIDLEKKKITRFEKKSFFDMMKIVKR